MRCTAEKPEPLHFFRRFFGTVSMLYSRASNPGTPAKRAERGNRTTRNTSACGIPPSPLILGLTNHKYEKQNKEQEDAANMEAI